MVDVDDYPSYPNYIEKAIPFFIVSMIIELSISIYKNTRISNNEKYLNYELMSFDEFKSTGSMMLLIP